MSTRGIGKAETNGKTSRFGEYALISVAEIHSDGTYQRPVSAWRVRDIVTNYQPILFQPLIIGRRKDTLYVVDGQHRLEAAVQMSFDQVPCMVYTTRTVEEEAKAFVWLQQFRRRITATQKFTARIAYRDPAATAISESLTRYGFEIGDYDNFIGLAKNNRIMSIAALETAYDEGGIKRVNDILHVLREAWDGRVSALDRGIIKGLAKFMAGTSYSRVNLAAKLKDIEPYTIHLASMSVGHSRGLRPTDACAAVIGNLYRGERATKTSVTR